MSEVLHFLAFVLPWCVATAAIRNEPSPHTTWVSLLIGACGAVMWFAVKP